MNFRDVFRIALGNLWRMKLRSFLTVSGVVIGIAALVSMLSFGAGVQINVANSFQTLDLFNALQIYPLTPGENDKPDTTTAKVLDDNTVCELARIPGVKSVYPEERFPVKITFGEKSTNTTIQGLPISEVGLAAYQKMKAGRFFQSDSVDEIVLRGGLLERIGVSDPDSIIGKKLTIITAKFDFASAMNSLLMGRELNPMVEVRREFTICGVMEVVMQAEHMGNAQIYAPAKTVHSMERVNFSNPFDLLSQLGSDNKKGYPYLNVRVVSSEQFQTVRDSIQNLGYHTFSFLDNFEEIRKSLLIFNAMLGVIGFIALVVASLGIVNTMVTSILERFREIGILKSLGAEDRHIRDLFLIESGTIGLIGALLGVLFGWVITRVGATIAKYYMVKEGGPEMELFAFPWWLIGGAILFGVVVAVLAGLYPAIRATRVDPVKALRHD
jgi:ABC-type antimicrobial peptide transport system permease subunit